jgi:hypothetical protein
VEFVGEREGARTPDLRVQHGDGIGFWVECKCRDRFSERDQKNVDIRQGVLRRIKSVLGPKKVNVAILVRFLRDLEHSDTEPVSSALISYALGNGIGKYDWRSGNVDLVLDRSGIFESAVAKFEEADLEIAGSFVATVPNGFDHRFMSVEMKPLPNGACIRRNPMLFASCFSVPSDSLSTLGNVIRAAKRQIPPEGPGVIWIAIPEGQCGPEDLSVQRVEKTIRVMLRGNSNRRINAVYLYSRLFTVEPQTGVRAYIDLHRAVVHDNPRRPVDLG